MSDHSFKTGDVISLKADNDKYLSRMFLSEYVLPILPCKSSIDKLCKFTVTVIDNRKIALKADNGKYMTRFIRDNKNTIEAGTSSLAMNCRFAVDVLSDGKITLQADNDYYLARAVRGIGFNEESIEAYKSSPDVYCRFTVVVH